MAPHLALPAVALLGVAGLTGVALALVGSHDHAKGAPMEGTLPPGPPPLEMDALATALLGALASAITLAATAHQLYSAHLLLQRRWEDRLDAGAADAVRATAGEYTNPLKRQKLANFLASEPFERSGSVGGLSELQHHACLFSRYSLALRLTPEEGEHALGMAADLLSEERPDVSEAEVRHAVSKAHSLRKATAQSTLAEMSSFIQKTRGGLVLTKASASGSEAAS